MSNGVKESSWLDRTRQIVLFQDPSPILSYKIRFSLYLTTVPLICSVLLVAVVLIFAKLNLYYLEGNGVIIDPQVRMAYYDQVISEVIPLGGYFGLLLVFTFALGMVVMNWATHPFVHAESALAAVLKNKKRIELGNNWKTESLDFEQTVQAFIDSMTANGKSGAASDTSVDYSLNYKFLFKFIAIFLPLSVITSLILRILIESVYGKIVSLALNLLHERTIQSHYILAQQEVLQDAQNITVFISIFAYAIIGRILSQHIATMIFVFTRAMRERRFPLRLRPTDIYHSLAATLNTIYEKH